MNKSMATTLKLSLVSGLAIAGLLSTSATHASELFDVPNYSVAFPVSSGECHTNMEWFATLGCQANGGGLAFWSQSACAPSEPQGGSAYESRVLQLTCYR
jgi:hypothetical protein